MSDLKSTSVKFLTLLVFLSLVGNLLVSCVAISKVRKNTTDFQLTEQMFRYAVGSSISNYLSTIVANIDTNTPIVEQPSIKVVFLDDLVIYYRPYKHAWVVRYLGSEFVEGDYFESGFIRKITDGRFYVQNNEEVVIFRPRKAADVTQVTPRPPRREDAPL